MTARVSRDRWNHNIHYHPLVLGAVPPGCGRALDVGCGDGLLARELRGRVPHVIGIDLHAPSLERARSQPLPGVEYVLGDVLAHPFEPASFELVAAVAALHHMDTPRGLERMVELLRPGGVLVVIGLARSDHPLDLAIDAAAVVASRIRRLRNGYWQQSAPTVWPPANSYSDVRALAAAFLPGAGYRRHLYFRYSLVWSRPAGPAVRAAAPSG
ncbi:MAG TPA: class I SAM-dependent methyltransferase [Myxococcota bacterium]|nr:class I SAM-dependent methyltransferase [Myxococcota bacterium]